MKMKSGLLYFILATWLTSITEGQRGGWPAENGKCNKVTSIVQHTPCTSCAASITAICPRDWTKATRGSGLEGCRYTVNLGETTLSLKGCSHKCMNDIVEDHCCPGFWGSECHECPSSRFRFPCNVHGTCMDGITGNGTCICKENFRGFACQDCKDENHYGPDCQSECKCQNGICSSGPTGDGRCTCYAGYTGEWCEQELHTCGSVLCEDTAHCVLMFGEPRCECLPGYRKVGRSQRCVVQDPCLSSPCASSASCQTVELTKYECTCRTGYQGDGKVCRPINPCVNNNGGCPENSTICKYLAPGVTMCRCKPGLMSQTPERGCLPVQDCPANFCDRTSTCEKGANNTFSCVCKDGEIGNGRSCFKILLSEISQMNSWGRFKGELNSAVTMFDLGCSLLLTNYGPFTVFVPKFRNDRFNFNVTTAENLCRMHIIPGQYMLDDMINTKGFWTLSGHQVTFSNMNPLAHHYVDLRSTVTYQYLDAPGNQYNFIQVNLPSANGIIHVVNKLRSQTSWENLGNSEKTIGEILASLDIASRFETILENCGLPSILDGPGHFTVFVPSNEAVDRLRDGRLIYLFTEGISKLQELVKHHIYPAGAVPIERLMVMPHILTMANQILTVSINEDGRILMGDTKIAINKRNIQASNGIIHTLDGIFIPPTIIPILPHRCNELQFKVVAGSCVDCDALNTSVCPAGSKVMEHGVFSGECVYIHDPLGLNIMKKGCKRYCNQTIVLPGCCKGFFGRDCTPCPGGFTNPCYGKGNCTDGIQGNGQCRCFEGFKGIACHICSNPNKHGENCDEDCGCVHGICDNRPGSKGICQTGSCKTGYTGEFCDRSPQNCGPAGASLICHRNAVCSLNDTASCVCLDGYEGDGFSCEPIDACEKPDRGGCSENAECTNTGPGTATCQCNKGWTGDGKGCVAIDNCVMDTRGGCHENADCSYVGPGQSICMCKKGYVGDGYSCDLINPCLMENGGCHELAECQSLGTEKTCRCLEGYIGDGMTCYGDIMKELARNEYFSTFFDWIKNSSFSIPREANVTALVPRKEAVQNLSKAEQDFWLQPEGLQFLVRAHFLQGSFTTEQLRKHVGEELPTLHLRTKWEINNINGTITIQNASIVVGDIPAINSTIHIINKVLLPPLGNIPPRAPELQQQLNSTPSFSMFKALLEQYQLIGKIESSEKYTIFIPGNNSIEEYCQASNITQLDTETVQYHVILGEKLFSENLKTGVHKSSMLGLSYWLMFYKNTTQAYVNKILLNGQFLETRNGMLIGISQVLQIQKNRCSTNTTAVKKSRCAKCDRGIKCPRNSVLAVAPGQGLLPHCLYKSGGSKTIGCYFTCVQVSLVSVCCEGYYGHMCEMCPGKPGNWCSGNGVCQDGIAGKGDCQCHEGYHGTACEMCQPGRYGANCQSECSCKNGTCNEGLLGDGNCTCAAGWTGISCDQQIGIDLCNGSCDVHANCINAGFLGHICVCSAGYTGNGTHCTEKDSCTVDNGGCSPHANCKNVSPGQRTCTCQKGYAGDGTFCREMNLCLENNGGCHPQAECIKTGPGLVACVCSPGYSGDGIKECELINPCKENNGGCSPQAICIPRQMGHRICICLRSTGDGITCKRTVWRELGAREGASVFLRSLSDHNVTELMGSGPYTVFVPHADAIQNSTMFSEWKKEGRIQDLLRYHIVSCRSLKSEDLELLDSITALSGHKINISMKKNSVYLNGEAKIIESDITGENGVIHFIDKILIPYDLQKHNISSSLSEKTITEVAAAYGYKIFSKLLVDAELLPLVNNTFHQPFTMLWPTDEALSSLPGNMQKWLFHREHRDKLVAFLKGHMIRDTQISASKLTEPSALLRTLHGSTISFNCSKTNVGDILVDNGNARIVQRYMKFNVGIAYGIDHLLEPPDVGSRCDEFRSVEVENSQCSKCGFEPSCPLGSTETGEKQGCFYRGSPLIREPIRYRPFERRQYWAQYSRRSSRLGYIRGRSLQGCKRTCVAPKWVPECCANHYGRDCQVCPGGLEAPCSNRGKCTDGIGGSGQCICNTTFLGTACEHCAPGHYGPECKECNCTENGICNEGVHGDGFCFCSGGWIGQSCEIPLAAIPTCSPTCHPNAVCRANNTCECKLYYEGDGQRCTVIDQCQDDNGGCSEHANCTQIGTDVSCSCFSDYEGDGYVCSPIDKCADGSNGGCSEHATCINTGPNIRRCECKVGYVGNGVQCFEEAVPPTDRCLEENGQCHPDALCTDLHFQDKTVGIFHLQSPKGKYQFTYEDAEAGCAAEGATLATIQQLSAAQQMGFHLCIVGWLFNRTAGYPTVYPTAKCGTHHVGIVNYGYQTNPKKMWDAYCYRAEDVRCDCKINYIGDGYTCTGNLVKVLGQNANFSIYFSMVLDYANATEEGLEFFRFLFSDASYKTIFAPLNSGFGDNTSLTLNDVKLHVSVSDLVFMSSNLTAGTIIPSQAGYNLSIADNMNSTQLLGSKLINNTVIVEWDILASNGIIHAIQAPLTIPVQQEFQTDQVSHAVKSITPMTIGASTVVAIVLLCVAIAGVAYYYLRRRNQGFQFHYFRAELEDEEPSSWEERSPHSVSIPNPMFTEDTSIYDPFGNSPCEDFADTHGILGD